MTSAKFFLVLIGVAFLGTSGCSREGVEFFAGKIEKKETTSEDIIVEPEPKPKPISENLKTEEATEAIAHFPYPIWNEISKIIHQPTIKNYWLTQFHRPKDLSIWVEPTKLQNYRWKIDEGRLFSSGFNPAKGLPEKVQAEIEILDLECDPVVGIGLIRIKDTKTYSIPIPSKTNSNLVSISRLTFEINFNWINNSWVVEEVTTNLVSQLIEETGGDLKILKETKNETLADSPKIAVVFFNELAQIAKMNVEEKSTLND